MSGYVIVAGDFVRTGGMDIANYALARYLAASGNQVELVCFRAAPELSEHPNVKVRAVPRPLRSYALGAPILGAEALRRFAHEGGRFVVNGGNAPIPGVNWVHYVHAAYKPQSAASWQFRLKEAYSHRASLLTERAALRRARHVVANSESTRAAIVERLGVAPERVSVVYYGSDPDRFYPADARERNATKLSFGWDDAPRVTFIGALGNRRKGFDVLWKAWCLLCRNPAWDGKLAVVGQGAELPRWHARAQAEGLEERVEFLGFRSDVPTILRASDLLVSPTRYEAYGLGVHEALCCGLPAIVSAASGVAELFPDHLRHLLLSDPEDVEELVQKLTEWRRDMGGAASAARAASAKLRLRTWDDMAREICGIADRLDWGS
jgi:glycosyltransferase involved in cell wall biosynthesis